jgi:hypothetical protein
MEVKGSEGLKLSHLHIKLMGLIGLSSQFRLDNLT